MYIYICRDIFYMIYIITFSRLKPRSSFAAQITTRLHVNNNILYAAEYKSRMIYSKPIHCYAYATRGKYFVRMILL